MHKNAIHETRDQRAQREARERLQSQPVAAARLGYQMNEAAILAGVSRATLYNEAARGNLKLIKVAGRTLVTPEALRDWFNQSATAA